MKTLSCLLLAITSIATFSSPAFAAEEAVSESSTANEAGKESKWNVRVEVLMVAMPEEKALSLLPALRDPAMIEAAVTQLLSAIKRKEAALMGLPVIHTLDGQRSVAETIMEKRYPTEYDLPTSSRYSEPPSASAGALAINDSPVPTAFETRNVGVTLEVEPHVSANGEWIHLLTVAQRTILLGFDSYDAVKTRIGKVVKIDQPQFFVTKATTSLKLRNGQRTLLAIHKLLQPENHIEFFIIQAFATSAE